MRMANNCQNFDHVSWNSTQNSDEYQLAYHSFQYAHQIVSLLLAIFYLVVISTLARNKSKLCSSFYTFVFSLSVVDLCALVILASGLINWKFSRREPFIWFVAFLLQFTWYGSVFNIIGLTISRLVAVFAYTDNNKVFINMLCLLHTTNK